MANFKIKARSLDQKVAQAVTDTEQLKTTVENVNKSIENINTEMTNVKKSVSDGKTLVANAITGKGISTATDATFEVMATNIASITTIEAASADMTATAADILSGKTGIVKGAVVTGSMANNGAVTKSLSAGGSYNIPAGFHNGSGKVSAATLASQTSGDATAAQILSGKKAWVNGSQITGSMTDRGAVSQTLAVNGTYTIPAGYHNGSGKVSQSLTTKAAATHTPGTSNKTAVAAGTYCSGAQTVKGDANLVAGNIKKGTSIFGVTGTYDPVASIGIKTYDMTVPVGSTVTHDFGGPVSFIYHIRNSRPNITNCFVIPGIGYLYESSNSAPSTYLKSDSSTTLQVPLGGQSSYLSNATVYTFENNFTKVTIYRKVEYNTGGSTDTFRCYYFA